jgi:hypothetical protein
MRLLVLLSIVLLLTACASPKPAPGSFDDANGAIDAALRAGAEEHSPVELRFAREKLEEARTAMDYGEYDKAMYLVEQSEINSELAIEKSRAAIVRAGVTELARENEILREDFEATFGEDFR